MLRFHKVLPGQSAALSSDELCRPVLGGTSLGQLTGSQQEGRTTPIIANDMIDQDDFLRTAAAEIFAMRRRRDKLLPTELVGEAAWDILLFAFQAEGEPLQLKELALASRVPETTAKRWLCLVEQWGLICRVTHPTRADRRAVYFELTKDGRAKVRDALKAMLQYRT